MGARVWSVWLSRWNHRTTEQSFWLIWSIRSFPGKTRNKKTEKRWMLSRASSRYQNPNVKSFRPEKFPTQRNYGYKILSGCLALERISVTSDGAWTENDGLSDRSFFTFTGLPPSHYRKWRVLSKKHWPSANDNCDSTNDGRVVSKNRTIGTCKLK